MIKFFRKIRQNLLVENKTEKYLKYALGEIILVMVGILLALQVSNLNQQRIAKNKEKVLLSELRQEFVENKTQFEEVTNMHQQVLDACNTWIAMFPIDLESVNLDSIPRTNIWRLKRDYTFNPTQGIINSLVSTSTFELISDRELRNLLILWNDVLEDYRETELKQRKYVLEVMDPYLNKHFHFVDILTDPRIDTSVLETAEFENLIYQRRVKLQQILNFDDKSSKIRTFIDRILELSDPENQ